MRISDSAPKLRIRTLRSKVSKMKKGDIHIGKPKIKRKRIDSTPRSIGLKNETPVKRLDQSKKEIKPEFEVEKSNLKSEVKKSIPKPKIVDAEPNRESVIEVTPDKSRPNPIIDIQPASLAPITPKAVLKKVPNSTPIWGNFLSLGPVNPQIHWK